MESTSSSRSTVHTADHWGSWLVDAPVDQPDVQICRQAFWSLLLLFVCFLHRILDFRSYCIVNIFHKMNYINYIIQCFSENWSLIFKYKNQTKKHFFAYTNNDLYSGYVCKYWYIFNVLCCNVVLQVKWFEGGINFIFFPKSYLKKWLS